MPDAKGSRDGANNSSVHPTSYYESLKPYCRKQAQIETLEAVIRHDGVQKDALEELGIASSALSSRIKTISQYAARKGWDPYAGLDYPAPSGMQIKHFSQQFDKDGEKRGESVSFKPEGTPEDEIYKLPDPKVIKRNSYSVNGQGDLLVQWIREEPELVARRDAWAEYADYLAQRLPILEPKPAPRLADGEDLLAAYPVGDHHLGLKVWHEESHDRADYDLNIGEQLLKGSMEYLLKCNDHCSHAFIPILGDFMHYDTVEPITQRSKNILDTDTRYPKMGEVAIDCLIYLIERALDVHQTVHVVYVPGNHDDSSAFLMTSFLAHLFKDNGRVTIDNSKGYFRYHVFGENLFGVHHGHSVKMEKLPLIMAADVPEMWGATKHRVIYTGHIHHKKRLPDEEFGGVDVEAFQILAPGDAYANQHGYRAGRSMKAIVYHRKMGEICRHTVSPEMLVL